MVATTTRNRRKGSGSGKSSPRQQRSANSQISENQPDDSLPILSSDEPQEGEISEGGEANPNLVSDRLGIGDRCYYASPTNTGTIKQFSPCNQNTLIALDHGKDVWVGTKGLSPLTDDHIRSPHLLEKGALIKGEDLEGKAFTGVFERLSNSGMAIVKSEGKNKLLIAGTLMRVQEPAPVEVQEQPQESPQETMPPLVDRVRSCLSDTDANWDWWTEDVKEVVSKFFGRKIETAGDRYEVLCAVNKCLPPASRCAYTQSQQELVESKLQHPVQLAKRIGKRFSDADGVNAAHFGAIGAVLDFYRAAWNKFEAWEKKQPKAVVVPTEQPQLEDFEEDEETLFDLYATDEQKAEELSQDPIEPIAQEEANCDRCQHQTRYKCAEGTAYNCNLGHINAVMTGGVIAESVAQKCGDFQAIAPTNEPQEQSAVNKSDNNAIALNENPSESLTSPPTVDGLIDEISDLYAKLEEAEEVSVNASRAAFNFAREMGDRLLQLKKLAPPGQWEQTRDRILNPRTQKPLPSSTATLYQRIAKHWNDLQSAGAITIREAIGLLKSDRREVIKAEAEANYDSQASAPTHFQNRKGEVFEAVAVSDTHVTLNRETEDGCVSKHLTREEVEKRFIPVEPEVVEAIAPQIEPKEVYSVEIDTDPDPVADVVEAIAAIGVDRVFNLLVQEAGIDRIEQLIENVKKRNDCISQIRADSDID